MAAELVTTALRAVTIYRPVTQKNKLKLTVANSSLLSEFCFLKRPVCLSFVIKMTQMTKLRQKLQISHFDVIRALRYCNWYEVPETCK